MKRYTRLAGVICGCLLAFAPTREAHGMTAGTPKAPSTGSASPQPRVVKIPGQPIKIIWPDGREAQFILATSAPIMVPVPVAINENECTGIADGHPLPRFPKIVAKLGCQFQTSYKIVYVALKWTKNPDPHKIGYVVTAVPKIPNKVPVSIDQGIVLNSSDRVRYPVLARGMPLDHLQCQDFSWLPGNPGKTAPGQIDLVRVTDEVNTPNPEIGISETAEGGDAFGVRYTRTTNSDLVLSAISRLAPLPDLYLPVELAPLPYPTIDWVMRTRSGSCVINMKADENSPLLKSSRDRYSALRAQQTEPLIDRANEAYGATAIESDKVKLLFDADWSVQ